MAEQMEIGTVKFISGIVKAVNEMTGEERILSVNDRVNFGEKIIT